MELAPSSAELESHSLHQQRLIKENLAHINEQISLFQSVS